MSANTPDLLPQDRVTAGVASISGRPTLTAGELRELALDCGADDAGAVSLDEPSLASEKPYILAAFPAAGTLLSVVVKMHREPVRSPARSVANHEFHSAGDELDEVARKIVGRLEDRGIRALNPPLAFPMEMQSFPDRGWVVAHKLVAEAAGLGRMGIHRNVIHPVFGNFILLTTVLIAADPTATPSPLDFNPCLSCKLCVAACPVGAIKPDGAFDFSACLTHNYHQFMGGFVNWVEDIADSKSAKDFRARSSYAENVERWQSLSYRPNYNSAYCLAVCPAGSDVIGPYQADKKGHQQVFLRPLQDKSETVYVSRGTDAADYVSRRFPHKMIRWVKPSARATTVRNFLTGATLSFQPGKAGDLSATYHFRFTGQEVIDATFVVKDKSLEVRDGHHGKRDLLVTADARSWIRFLDKEISILFCLTTGKIRLRGSPKLLAAFGRCFPS
jgi:ferredoxin